MAVLLITVPSCETWHYPLFTTAWINFSQTWLSQSRDILQHCGLIDDKRPKLMRWLESHPGFTVVEDKVGFNVGDCAHGDVHGNDTD